MVILVCPSSDGHIKVSSDRSLLLVLYESSRRTFPNSIFEVGDRLLRSHPFREVEQVKMDEEFSLKIQVYTNIYIYK